MADLHDLPCPLVERHGPLFLVTTAIVNVSETPIVPRLALMKIVAKKLPVTYTHVNKAAEVRRRPINPPDIMKVIPSRRNTVLLHNHRPVSSYRIP